MRLTRRSPSWARTRRPLSPRGVNHGFGSSQELGRTQHELAQPAPPPAKSAAPPLIAQRDDEIRVFDARPFWELRTRYRGARFRHAGERFREQAPAQELLAKVTDQPLRVDRLERRTESLPPPLLHDLTQLQRDMNLRHGLSAQRTLEVAQELYEKKLLTYPRTDSRHLPLDMVDDARTALSQLRAWDKDKLAVLARWIQGAPDGERGPKARKKRVFDDDKVSDHHAIVPTGRVEALTAP